MSKGKTLRRYISGFLILMASLTAMPASQAAAQIFQGEAKPKIFYSDSGAAVENPVTNTDLDNFSISLHYGTMEEDLGDTLLLQDASISIPVTVSIEYTGEECYNAGDLTFTLQDIEGLSRQGNGSSLKPFAITTDIGAEKYGSGSNRGDWYYYSEEMENHSNSYVFCNKNDLEGPFTSSVEMISTISHIGTARNGFSQTINSTLSIEGIGDRICRPLYFSNYTSPTTFTMKPFVWEPYKAMWQQEIFPCAGSPDDYEIIRICLDFDQTVNSRIFGDTSPDSFQEGSFAQVNIIAPEGIEVMNPDGSFNTPQRICSSSAGDPFLDGLIPESEYIPAPEPEFIAFIPKSLYPAGSSVTITAELHGRYYDDFAPFSTFTTQTIQIPSTADPNAELSPYDSENPDTPISIIDPSETISVSSTAVWEDEDNQDGIRPDFVDVQLYADNIPNGDPVRLNVENNWTSVWNDLPKYISGSPVSYSVKDVTNTDGYTISSEGSPETGFSLIYTHAPDKTSVHGSVVWEDDDNIDSLRPDTVTINLYADENKIDSTTVSADSDWTFTFENIDKNRGGKPVPYTISEDPVESIFQDNPIILYQTRYEQERIINYLSPHMIRFSTSIEWDDNQDKDGNHPDSVTVRLMKNEKEIQAGTASSANDWKLSFEDCPLYENGKQIHYTLKQDPADGYQPPEMSMDDTIKSAAQTGLLDISSVRIKNRFAGKQDITVTASWTDEDDSDGIRPESLTVRLYADKTEIESFSMTADSKWSHTFKDLPVYSADKIIAYTIDAEEIDGYETTINGFDISNSHSPEKLAIHGTITWDDSDNQDAVRPEKIILHLLADDKEIDSATVATSDEWKYSFDEHEIRKAGQKIRYAITEDSIPGYTAQIDGFNVINIHDVEKLTIDGEVLWEDANDYDHLRPGAVTLHLSSNGEELSHTQVLSSSDWKYSFPDLPKYKNGTAIRYSISEDQIAGYTNSVIEHTVINTHHVDMPHAVLPDTASISGSVTWDDSDNADKLRPSSVTIRLLAGGKKIDSKHITEKDSWKYSFTGLPKSENGKAILYTIDEDKVDGYRITINGYNVTNTHKVQSRNTSVPSASGNSASGNGASGQVKPSPATGDDFPAALMTVLLLVSLLIISCCTRKKIRTG